MSLAENVHRAGPRFEGAAEFLAWVERQPERWELWDGVARMMTGGSLNHSRLSRNALTALATRLGPGPCEAFGSDAAVVLGPRRVAYPDISVSCEPEDGMSVAHPVVIIEVLSPSTASYDLDEKASAYRRIASLRHLVFVRQERVSVQHLHRDAGGEDFTLTDLDRIDGILDLAAIGVGIILAELYARVALAG